MSTQEKTTTRQLVVTTAGDILCGIEIDAVHEIIPMQAITNVPKSPRNMLGVTDVRGAIIPVADLRGCLGLPIAEVNAETRIVLVSYGEEKIGLVVDAVAEVITLDNETFQTMDGNIGGSSFFRAVARLEDRLILDIDHVRVIEDGLDTPPAELASLLEKVTAEATAEEPASEETTEEENESEEDAGLEETTGENDESQKEIVPEINPQANVEEFADEGGLNVELLQSSFALLAPKGEELVDRFYTRLFETAPAVRSLFPEDMAGQKKALLGALATVVSSLRAPEKLTKHLEELGQRHVGFGAAPEHYDVVGDVLLATLAELAGEAWNDELETAWTDAFGAIKGIMLAGAAEVKEAA